MSNCACMIIFGLILLVGGVILMCCGREEVKGEGKKKITQLMKLGLVIFILGIILLIIYVHKFSHHLSSPPGSQQVQEDVFAK